jgi:hypothetical protein
MIPMDRLYPTMGLITGRTMRLLSKRADFLSLFINAFLNDVLLLSHYQCKNVMPYCEIRGQILLSETRVNFAADEKSYKYLMVILNCFF